jgi:mono/diheme cytochrome c family protein
MHCKEKLNEAAHRLSLLQYLPLLAALSLQCQALAGSNNATKPTLGETVFNKSCWSCHANKDSNLIDPEKTIAKSNKLGTLAGFKTFLSRGHGQMPPWKTIVRNQEELKSLYEYVKNLKTGKTEEPSTGVQK